MQCGSSENPIRKSSSLQINHFLGMIEVEKEVISSMENKHTKKLWLIPILVVAGILLAGIIFFFTLEIPQKLRGYDALKTFLEQPSFSAEITLDAQVEGTPISASGCLHKLPVENKSVYALTTEGITLGYYDGTVYLENG